MSETIICEMRDRRQAMRPARTIRLYDDRLEWAEGSQLIRRLPFDQIREVRLSVEMAGQQSQVVCRVSSKDGEIVFGSRSVVSPSVWEDNVLAFQTLIVAVHTRLKPHRDHIQFVEGQTLRFRLVLSGIGASMASAAIGYSGWMLLNNESTMLAVAGLPFAVIGGYLTYVFRPGRPVPYDPDGLIKRFTTPASTD